MRRHCVGSCALVLLAACSSAVTVSVEPGRATVAPGETVVFRALVFGSDDTAVAWSVQEGAAGGTIDTAGRYLAPGTPGTYHVVASPRAAPGSRAAARVEVVLPAGGVALTTVTPPSPANDNRPRVSGVAGPGATVAIHADPACATPPLGTGIADAAGAFELRLTVDDDSTTRLHATATVRGTTSPCTASALTYVEDSTPPAPPVLGRVSPGATGTDAEARFAGSAEAGSIVTLHDDAGCANAVAQGPAADFVDAGLAVAVEEDASVSVRATATDAAGNVSACSSTTLTYARTGTTPEPPAWRGPQARLERTPGTNEAFIVIDGVRHRPVFVSVNPQAIQDPATGWPTLLAQIDLAAAQGMPIVDLMLANRSVAFLAELASRLGSRQVYLWLRFEVWIPEAAGLGVPLLKSLAGDERPGYRRTYALSRDGVWSEIPFFSTLDEEWLTVQKASLRTLLDDLARSGIGDRVVGVRTTYMAGGEWFQPPLAFHDGALVEDPPGKWPWSHPEAFSVGDYSARERAHFATWLAGAGLPSTTPFPEPADRIHPRLGRTFVVGADGSNVAAALYHRFVSERVARIQEELGRTAKEATQSKALVMVNNGYLVSIAHYNGSSHTAFDRVLRSPWIDAVAAPYNYDTLGTRRPGAALVAHGPMDSPALHDKLWIHEDDSRPHWSPDGFRATSSWAEDRALLLRNAVTSLVHGNGLYFFDLPNHGWFGGNPQYAAETRTLYETVRALKAKLDGQLSRSGPVQAQIAIFVDDDSSHLYPEFGLDGAASYGTANELLLRMVERVSSVGAPVRVYLLDDLGDPALDVAAVRLAFFLNTPRLTQAHREHIRTRLARDGRVLAFQHVAGLFDETLQPSWALAADYSPGVSSLANVEASTSHAVTLADRGTHVVAYAPRGADRAGIEQLASRAGVHRYATDAIVDGAGRVLMVHARGGTVDVQLPSETKVIDLLSDATLCAGCRSVTLNLAGPDTRVLGLLPANAANRRLFRHEFVPGSYGGAITTDERTYCVLPDGDALLACGFTVADYMVAPLVGHGHVTMTSTGACTCR